jgi:hypothetical protein
MILVQSTTTNLNHPTRPKTNTLIKTGVISGVLAMPTFPKYFGIVGDASHIATMKGDVVSVLQAGCCVGALLINLLAGKLPEKKKVFTFSTTPAS